MDWENVQRWWMLLDVGLALRDGVPDYTVNRDALSLETIDGKTIPLPSIIEHREGNTAALQNRAKVKRDSINYFPPNASQACALVFFPTWPLALCRGMTPS